LSRAVFSENTSLPEVDVQEEDILGWGEKSRPLSLGGLEKAHLTGSTWQLKNVSAVRN